MMVSPIRRPECCHQKYHQFVGMERHPVDLTGTIISQKPAENSHFWDQVARPEKAFW
jgi:hypothetical protein